MTAEHHTQHDPAEQPKILHVTANRVPENRVRLDSDPSEQIADPSEHPCNLLQRPADQLDTTEHAARVVGIQANTRLGITKEEAAELESCTVRWVEKRLDRGDYREIPTDEVAPNGRPIRLIDVQSLSDAAFQRWLERTRGRWGGGVNSPVSEIPCQPKAGVPVTPDGLPDFEALARYGRHDAIKKTCRRVRAVQEVQGKLAAAAHGRRGSVWREVAAGYGLTVATLRRIEREYREGGPAALVPGYGHARGKLRAIPEDLELAIRETWLQPTRRNAKEIYRHVVRPWCRERGAPTPHYATVARFIRRRILPVEAVILRQGKKAYENGSRPHIFRDVQELAVNELWCADHRKLDLFCWPPDGARRPIRPWVTAIIDVRSAAWVGWTLWLTPSGDTIACALRRAMMTYGLPKSFYRDNGRDFQARRFGTNASVYRGVPWDDISRYPALLDSQHRGAFEMLGIETIDALPYQAWSKPVESLFAAWSKRYENLIPGWCGSDAKAKPEKLERELKDGRILPWTELVALFDRSVTDWNTGEPIGDRKQPPINYYEGGAYEPRMVSEQSLAFLLARHKRMAIHDHGVQMFGDKRRTYMCKELAAFIGCRADVRWDPWDIDSIWVHPQMDIPDDEFPARFGCSAWIKAPKIALGSYREHGEPAIEAQRARKQLRQVVGMRMDEVAGAASLDSHDPLGAFRTAAACQARAKEDLAQRAIPASLPPAPDVTDGEPVDTLPVSTVDDEERRWREEERAAYRRQRDLEQALAEGREPDPEALDELTDFLECTEEKTDEDPTR